jgi:hypothetical protein
LPDRPSRSSSKARISVSAHAHARCPIQPSSPRDIFSTGRELLTTEADGTLFRLIGIGVSALSAADGADFSDLIDRRAAEAEQAIDRLRKKYGDQAIIKGLAFDDNGGRTTEDG